MRKSNPFFLRVWGKRACFTHPATKIERMSYPVITPSASEGIFGGIFWKPEFDWHIQEIIVEAPIVYGNIRRNEVSCRGTYPSSSVIAKGGEHSPIDATSIEDKVRIQRNTLFLRDVSYVISGVIRLRDSSLKLTKYEEMFERRASSGQGVYQPYLGCREFVAFWEYLGREAPQVHPIQESLDLGMMPLQVFRQGVMKPQFFRAKMINGVVHVPGKEG